MFLPEKVGFGHVVMARCQFEGRAADGQRPHQEQAHRQGHEEHGKQQVGGGALPGPTRVAEPLQQEGGRLCPEQGTTPHQGGPSRRAV